MAEAAQRRREGRTTPASSSLVKRNIVVAGHRTSARLEPVMWEALREIACRNATTLNELVTDIDVNRGESSLTAAIRVYIVRFYRAAAMRAAGEESTRSAAHGVER
jgi:predicted DNA-binding ribbon-helix-helix protein